MSNIPTLPGVYPWQDKTGFVGPKGKIHNVDVVNVGEQLNEVWLRVYWEGGYWDVTPQPEDPIGEQVCWPRAGWEINA